MVYVDSWSKNVKTNEQNEKHKQAAIVSQGSELVRLSSMVYSIFFQNIVIL